MNKDERLLIAIDEELKAKLQQAAVDQGISMSEVVRRLIASIPVIGRVEGDKVILEKE